MSSGLITVIVSGRCFLITQEMFEMMPKLAQYKVGDNYIVPKSPEGFAKVIEYLNGSGGYVDDLSDYVSNEDYQRENSELIRRTMIKNGVFLLLGCIAIGLVFVMAIFIPI